MHTDSKEMTTETVTNAVPSNLDILRTVGFATAGAVVSGSVLGMGRKAGADSGSMNPGMAPAMAMAPSTSRAVFGDLMYLRSDVDILNFALLLEYLESDYYTRVVQANTLTPFLQTRTAMAALKLRDDENAHVIAVTQRVRDLGGTPAARPTFQFPAETFRFETSFLEFSTTLEQTGVHAYLGAAPLVKNAHVLRFAASIYGIEARHTAAIRNLSGRNAAPVAFEQPLSGVQIADMASPFFIV